MIFFSFSELNDKDGNGWTKLNYAGTFELDLNSVKDNVERIHVKDISPDVFIEKYEKLYKPVVISGCTDHWKARYKWTLPVSFSLLMYYFYYWLDVQFALKCM